MRIKLLKKLLTYRRPADSKTERKWVAKFLDTVPGMQRDDYGNRFVKIGTDSPQTMISCHTDTVHGSGGQQRIETDHQGIIHLAPSAPRWSASSIQPWKSNRDCLGADDAAGVFVALEMIRARVPALYVFHRAEEVGGLGSSYLTQTTPDLTNGILRCIALDRRGDGDIITHQAFGRCCSDEFAEAFSGLLRMNHQNASGTFTDSANYVDIVGECTNISVGYEKEHSPSETLDTFYLEELIDRLSTVDLDTLPCSRQPGDPDPDDMWTEFRFEEESHGELIELGEEKPSVWEWTEAQDPDIMTQDEYEEYISSHLYSSWDHLRQ